MSNEEQQKEMLNGLSTLYGQFARLIHEADELDMWNVESENFKSICKSIGASTWDVTRVIQNADHVVHAYTSAEMTDALQINQDQNGCANQESKDAQE